MSGAKACALVQSAFTNPVLTAQLALAIAYALWAYYKLGNPLAGAWLLLGAMAFNAWAACLQPSVGEGLVLYGVLSMILVLEVIAHRK
jgi:hypothetical protein